MLSPNNGLVRRAILVSLIVSSNAIALPKPSEVKVGQASIETDSNTMTILQHSDRLGIDYQSFDIASHESVIFQQPNVNSVALNRVVGNDASQIFGTLQANGHVFLVNPNGIIFGEHAHVDVGSLLASTKTITDEAFLNGDYHFSGDEQTAIVNKGLIQAANEGLIVFVANYINNEGKLIAPEGRIELVSSDEVILDISGEAVSIISNQAAMEALIENHGLVSSDGGVIVFNVDAREALEQTVVNNTGVVKASGFAEKNGEIYILGNDGDVILDGELSSNGFEDIDAGTIQIDANRIAVLGDVTANGDVISDGGNIGLSANSSIFLADGSRVMADGGIEGNGGRVISFTPENAFFASNAYLSSKGGTAAGDGGFLEVSGLEKVEIFGQVDTSAKNGQSGTFYIDPYDITISNAVSVNGAFDAGNPNSWEGSGVGTSSTINSAAITAALAGSSVIINTALDNGTGPGTGTGTITINSDIDLDGGNGNSLSLVADDSITLAANVKIEDKTTATADAVNVSLTSSNNITFNNDADIFTTGGNALIVASNNVVMAGNSSIQTGAGTITINASDIDLVGLLRSNSTSDTAISLQSFQQIADSGAATIDIDAPNGGVVLDANNGINLDINATKLDLTNTASGAVTIEGNGDLEVVDIIASAASVVSILKNNENGNSGGAVTISGYTASGNLVVSSDSTITLPDAGLNLGIDDLSLTAADLVDISGRDVFLSADDLVINLFSIGADTKLSTAASTIDLTHNGASLLTVEDADSIQITGLAGTGNSLIDVDVLTIPDAGITTSGDLAIVATDIVDVSGRDLTISANDLYLNIASLGANTSLNTSIDTLDANFAGTGNVVITNDKALQLLDSVNDVNANSLIWSTNDLSIVTTAGDLTLNDAVELDGLMTGEMLALNATNDLLINTNVSDEVGAVDHDVRIDLDAGNAITMSSTASIDAGDGTAFGFIDLDAVGDITLTGLKTLSASGSAIAVTSTTGAILDAGDVNTDIEASNALGRVQLSAETGINDIETLVGFVDLSNTTSGTITINEVDDIGVFSINSIGDVSINSGANLTISNDIDLEGADGATYTFNALNNIDIDQNVCEGGNTCSPVNDNVQLDFIAGGDITNAAGATLNPGLSALGLNAGGTLTLDDTGLLISGALTLDAGDIVDSDRSVTVSAGSLTLDTQTAGGDSIFNTTISSLDFSNTGANQITINEADALTISSWSTNGDSLISLGGALIIPDSGLNSGVNGISIIASDISDSSGRDLNITADQFSLDLSNPSADLTLNTNVNELQAILVSAADLSVNQATQLALADIESLGSAITLSEGDLTISSGTLNVNADVTAQQGSLLLAASGDMNINADVIANDLVSDSIREGLIDLSVDGGALTIGGSGSASVVSNNTSDQSAFGGLGTEPSDAVSIRIRQLDTGTSMQSFVFGDGIGSDTLVRAVGGDIYVDSVGGGGMDPDGNRPVILNSDVTIESFNDMSDPNTGLLSTNGVVGSGAMLSALANRAIQINTVPLAPPVVPSPEMVSELPESVESAVSDLLAEEQSTAENNTDPLDTSDPSIIGQIESDNSQVSKTFGRAFQACSDTQRSQDSTSCRMENVMVQFLSSFIVGGALPGGGQ